MLAVLLVALALAAPPPAPRPAPEVGTSALEGGILQQLTRRADGGYEHANRRAGFTATIHSDGTVTFRDLVVADGKLRILGIDVIHGEAQVPDATRPSNTLVRPNDLASLGDGPLVKDGPYGPVGVLVSASLSMAGIADLAVATRRASAKQRFLDLTEPMRTKMAAEHRRATERTALVNLDAELRTLWGSNGVPASVRRERLFQRWDECVQAPEDPQASADELARARAGEQARRRIEAWIRRHVPQTDVDAFTPAELREMNLRRRSRGRFDPYGRAVAPPTAGPTAPQR